ncbi:MAG: molybdopterin-dependent oxidoreductase [Anaerolineae bacterium]|nr:molybdopterin-dependent oxidoreductase [Anaerolineae bacterium]
MTNLVFQLNGQTITAHDGETILQAAKRQGVQIPHLCYKDGLTAEGNCRACVVEIDGERALQPSCCRMPKPNMVVKSDSPRALHSQKMVLEMLKADAIGIGVKETQSPIFTSELDYWADQLGVDKPRFAPRHQPNVDLSHPAIAVNLDTCIQCTRCVRACRDVQVNDVIGMAFRGDHAKIVFDLDDPMGDSTCVGCGECVQACPTGALLPKTVYDLQLATNQAATKAEADHAKITKTDSVCPYCGVGCLLTFHSQDNHIIKVEGRDGPSNHGRLCVKGRFGFDYVHHKERLTQPLIRKAGVPKTLDGFDPTNPLAYFREATWEEALDLAAGKLAELRKTGNTALAGFGSAKGSNEEAYLFQKLVRLAFGNNNVDHCTRLCHASSVSALLEGIGSAAVSNQVADVADAECIIVIGSNPTVNHPVAATFMKNAVKAGKTLIVMDPRRTEIARHAKHYLQFKPDTDVLMLNSLLHTIIAEGLVDENFVGERTEDYVKLMHKVADYAPEKVAPLCGIPAETLREVARTYATAKASIIFWGMGVSQHIHGTDNARCLIALSLITGQIGRPGTGLHPLRGQNNVQGASDAGLIPMMLPDYRRVANPDARRQIEELWGATLDPKPGLTVVEIMHAVLDGQIKGMYIMGENPAMSDPDLNHSRAALAALEHLVVQDIFLTETCAFADVVLPASAFPEKDGTFTNTDRRVQLGRKAINPPGNAREDLWIILQMAQRLGMNWDYGQGASGRGQVASCRLQVASEKEQVKENNESSATCNLQPATSLPQPATSPLPLATVQAVYDEMRQAMPSIGGLSWAHLAEVSSVTYPYRQGEEVSEPVLFQQKFPTASGKARIVPADFIHANELPDTEYPFVFLTGRQLEHWHTGAMTRRASKLDALEPAPTVSIHPDDLAELGAVAGDMIEVASRRGQVQCMARADRGLQHGEVFMPFAYVEAAANLVTNEAIDPFGKIPEFKFCAVKVRRC